MLTKKLEPVICTVVITKDAKYEIFYKQSTSSYRTITPNISAHTNFCVFAISIAILSYLEAKSDYSYFILFSSLGSHDSIPEISSQDNFKFRSDNFYLTPYS